MRLLIKKLFVLNIILIICQVTAAQITRTVVSMGVIGDEKNVETPTRSGTVLIGGGGNVNPAFKWMIDRSGGGDVVVITASGNSGYTKDIFSLGE